MPVVSGDIVAYGDQDCVVVDVADDLAVLRASDDLTLESPIVAPANGLEVVGHLTGDEVPGWTETEHGVWEQTG